MAETPNMLCRDLSDLDRAILVNMTHHQGFDILVRMMHEACDNATARVIKLDPIETDNYEKKLANLQLTARATHQFCASVLKSIQVHQNQMIQEDKQQQEEAELQARISQVKSMSDEEFEHEPQK